MFPPGGQAGQTIDVVLGGYDWTPDMEVFVLDSNLKLEIVAPPGPILVAEPPYWFERKARRVGFLQPRETRARLSIPADTPRGVVRWQVANANGAAKTGCFAVGSSAELVEIANRHSGEAQQLPFLPVTVAGQIKKIAEVDRYTFTPERTGPITCEVIASGIQSPLLTMVEVHDDADNLIAELADTVGRDCRLTFTAQAHHAYTISVNDVDFRGNRAFVYRMSLFAGPRIVAAIPAAGSRGDSRSIEFVGFGIASGVAQLETVKQQLQFPADQRAESFPYVLETSYGTTPPFELLVSDLVELVEPAGDSADRPHLTIPSAITGTIDRRFGTDRYLATGKQDEIWSLSVQAAQIGSALDVVLCVFDGTGKELIRTDDLPASTDTAMEFTLPDDGTYEIGVSDISGNSGDRASTYRLVLEQATPDFSLSAAELFHVPIGDKAELVVTAKRNGGFNDPIQINVSGAPHGIEVPEELSIETEKTELKIKMTAAADAAAQASLVTITGSAQNGDELLTRSVRNVLVATTMKPPFTVTAEGKDDTTKWPRGTTFPAPVLIERMDGFDSEIVLVMSAKNGRHRQGIWGPEFVVPSGVERILYPVFLPEWLETTRTSRMILNGVAKVNDPQGNSRYSVSRIKSRIGFIPEGALLKISSDITELETTPLAPFEIPLTLNRSPRLSEPVSVELRAPKRLQSAISAEPVVVAPGLRSTRLQIVPTDSSQLTGEHRLRIVAKVMQQEKYLVQSETSVLVAFINR